MKRARLVIGTDFVEWEPSDTAQVIIEGDSLDRDTGLVDVHGDPIFRRIRKLPMGFHGVKS